MSAGMIMRGEKGTRVVNRIPYFETEVKKMLQSMTSAGFKRRTRNINVKISNDERRCSRAERKRVNKGKKTCVVIRSSSQISIIKGEIDVDNVKLLSNTNAIKFNGA
jgi:hypothetical protein